MNTVMENGAEAGVRRGRWGGEAGTGRLKVASVGMGPVKAEELDSPGRGVTTFTTTPFDQILNDVICDKTATDYIQYL
jgi:hypothetical protein